MSEKVLLAGPKVPLADRKTALLAERPWAKSPASSDLLPGLSDFASLRMFARVVELKSFSEAARRLGITPSSVSKHISLLEEQLGTRVFNRTTRQLFVTDAGARLYARYQRVVDELRQAQDEISTLQSEPMGHLRVSLPQLLGARLIAPRLPDLLKRHPKISIELDLSVEKVDVFSEQIDVAVRIADTLPEGVVAIRMAPYRRVFCASPEYLAEHGTPQTPQDLASHCLLIARGGNPDTSWPVLQDGVARSVPVSGRLISNHGDPIYDALKCGLGISMQPRWRVDEELKSGSLVEVLPECVVDTRSIWAVLSQRGAMSPKVRVLVEFLRQQLKGLD